MRISLHIDGATPEELAAAVRALAEGELREWSKPRYAGSRVFICDMTELAHKRASSKAAFWLASRIEVMLASWKSGAS